MENFSILCSHRYRARPHPMARLHTEIMSDEMDEAVNIYFAEVTRDK